MMNSTRQELLEVIAAIGEFVPEVRLGQLVANLSSLPGRKPIEWLGLGRGGCRDA